MVLPLRQGITPVGLPSVRNNQKRGDQTGFAPRSLDMIFESKMALPPTEQWKEVLGHDIYAPARFFDLAFFGSAKNDVAYFFIIETRLCF